ncbi:hypothetical protein M8998_13000 [Sphingobacterium sp. lm-10]|uniref:hypothetical protein n=1 Tax=Sphingobacterium sp. lm-10 TaxID=2944904 RepID=UPI0020200ECD|nr:hypothetical protein [Sphingobacterium sp. lm-10]MCL7988861.1 hypothetical protein [Sphingobacterium sp. lm-10]
MNLTIVIAAHTRALNGGHLSGNFLPFYQALGSIGRRNRRKGQLNAKPWRIAYATSPLFARDTICVLWL